MVELKMTHTSLSGGSHYMKGGAPGSALRRGVESRALVVPREYERKIDLAELKYDAGGALRQRFDAMREVVPIVFGSLGESSDSVRELANAVAEVAAVNRSCRADFNLRAGVDQAKAAISWYLLRRWGRLAIIGALELKETALMAVAGSSQAEERRRREGSGMGGAGDEYWFQRGSSEDAGASFMGAGAGMGMFGA